ncbi:MAG: amidase family protein [PVC group bacterium]
MKTKKKPLLSLNRRPAADGRGELAGVSVLISPNFSVRGRPAGAVSRALKGFTAPEDSTAVRLLREAGAAFPGAPRISEMGFGLAGDTTAATLEGTRCTAALGLDTLGEIRVAATGAAVTGYKPSYGIFSRAGVIGLVPSMECPGVAARDISPIRKIAAVLATVDEEDFSMLRRGLPDFRRDGPPGGRPATLGVIRECLAALLPEETEALRQAVAILEKRGYTVREVTLPDFDIFPLAHQIIGSVEASSSAGNYDGVRFGYRAKDCGNWNEMYIKTRGEAFGTLLKSYLFQGAYFQFRDYAAFENACRIRRRLVEETEKIFGEVDFLLLPTRRHGREVGEEKTVAGTYQAFAFTLPANVTGSPAVSLPGFAVSGGTDLGLQVVGPHLSDARLLEFAGRIADSRGGAPGPVKPGGGGTG